MAAKTDLLERDALKTARLRDGTFRATVFGYSDYLHATGTVRNTRITDVKRDHQERADLRTLLPDRIVREQRVDVDGVAGAAVTSQAIKSAVFQALKQAAGL